MAPSVVRALVVTLVVLSFSASGGRAQVVPSPVRLRAGDAVRLEVRDEPKLGGDFQVDEAGRVLLPLVGLVSVVGRDFEDVRRDVGAAFARELSHGDVRITPLLRIAVLGEVRQPGLYPIDPTYTLADVLAGAGGFGPEADRNRIELVRDGRVIASVPERDVAGLGQTLRSGDQVVVARRGWLRGNSSTLVGAGASLMVAVLTALILR